MWQQNYTPIAGSLLSSSLIAAIPIAVLLYAIGIKRVAAWQSSLMGLAAALLVALAAYRMPRFSRSIQHSMALLSARFPSFGLSSGPSFSTA